MAIYSVTGRRDQVVKVFPADAGDLASMQEKISVMVHSAPAGAVQPDGFVVLAWPIQPVSTDDGAFGYTMPRIDTDVAVTVDMLSNPRKRLTPPPDAPQWTKQVTWRHLVRAASNLCLAVDVAHRAGLVVADLAEGNIMVDDTCRVSLIGCDSMQFVDTTGRQFLCPVGGEPEFAAPELVGADLRSTPRSTASDLFALAVHIHLLLMQGKHPPVPSNAVLPPGIRQLFSRAFVDGSGDPAARPTAAEWRSALEAMAIGAAGTTPAVDEPRVRRRDWKVAALAALGVLAAVVLVFGGAGADRHDMSITTLPVERSIPMAVPAITPIVGPPTALGQSPIPAGPVTYSITGTKASTDEVTVTFTDPTGSSQTFQNVPLPWEMTMRGAVGEIRASSGHSRLNCSITDSYGQLLSTNTSHTATVSC